MLWTMWSLLLVTLPSQPNAVRLRIWRALKALGCAALRDGAYLLPASQVAALDALADEVRSHGGTASVLCLAPRDAAQAAEWPALFDRSEGYAAWRDTAAALQLALPALTETEARRRWRGTADALATLRAIDYFAGAAAVQAAADLAGLRAALDSRFSRGEPQPTAAMALPRLDRDQFQGQCWATRARPWVDRLACAWLIRRFIDQQPTFIWLATGDGAPDMPPDMSPDMSPDTLPVTLPVTPPVTPPGALGYDYDGARFSHVGALVTFEVLIVQFGLADDAPLRRIAGVVHCLDAGGLQVPEAAGLEGLLAGLRQLHDDDDALAAAAATLFDALYAAPTAAPTDVAPP